MGAACSTECLQQADQLEMLGVFQLTKMAMLYSIACLRNNLNTEYILVLSTKFPDAQGQLILIFLPSIAIHGDSLTPQVRLALDSCTLKIDTCLSSLFGTKELSIL